ncbi:extracellular solute-binding protein [uncultured Ruminococcus sp.]|uniref:extracellular solute-binding protein n=1 Tax=uncultured Ruminococcus sp. TaxID=165186 RepID=UPI0029311499|nr:extracellular solute-binding protein [uncultured Ruminococcus sp.]
MKKFVALVLAVLMMASVLVACGGGNKGGEATKTDTPKGDTPAAETLDIEDGAKLLVWSADKAVDLTKKLCEDFKAAHADKNIEIEVQVQGEDAAATQLLKDPDAAADVFSFASDQLSRLLKADSLAPVFSAEDVIARNSEDSVTVATVDGELMAFPETCDNGYCLIYDKSVVSDEQAKTLEGVLEACKAAGVKFVIDAGNGFYSCMFPFTGGLKIDGIKDDVQQFNDYNEDEVVATLKAFSDLFHKYSDIFMSSEDSRINAGFQETPHTVGAGIDGPWNVTADLAALGDNFGAAKLPTINVNGEDKQIISLHGFKYIGVNAVSKYPYAAQALADFLTNKESQVERAKAVAWAPSNEEALKDPAVTENAALSAIFEQKQYSVLQSGIAETFWTPMGALGNYLWQESANDEASIKAQLEKAIMLIKDE